MSPWRDGVGVIEGDGFFIGGHQAKVGQLLMVWMVGDPAIRAEASDETLRHHTQQGGTHQKGLHTHLVESRKGTNGIVAMEGGEHEVARQGCFDGGAGRFQVSGLSHQEHIGVLTHERPQGRGEVVTLFSIDLGLGDAGQSVFNRVFDRGDVDPRVVAFGENGIKGGGFA